MRRAPPIPGARVRGKYPGGPAWRRGLGWRTRVPPGLNDWLYDTDSLTRRLQAACPGRFEVALLGQAWCTPLPDERRVLGLRRGEHALVRHVYLRCAGTPWVFARTVIPRRTLRGSPRRLALLGTRPLGAVLFADPTMRRSVVEVAPLRPGQTLYDLAAAALDVPPPVIWGRRSLFWLDARPLLVNEIFLPPLVQTGQYSAK